MDRLKQVFSDHKTILRGRWELRIAGIFWRLGWFQSVGGWKLD
jgi:hypothetical protein